ncbi:MAG TPA: metallophosphoesterase [Opitutaceae bacterium]|nr:metallophosphoesterase [Opitutaceae bacterium]
MIRTEISPGLWLDARLALWFEAHRLLVVADLHWGYAVSHQAHGNLLPSWGDEEVAARLRGLIADYAPDEIIWLGDCLHTIAGREPAETFLRTSGAPVTIVSGNHDRHWRTSFGEANPRGEAHPASVTRGGFVFHHGHLELPIPPGGVEVIGHHHPALAWSDRAGGRIKLPALIASPRRLILPAFSPWAAGAAWNPLLEEGETLFAIAPKRIFAVSRDLLLKSRNSA